MPTSNDSDRLLTVKDIVREYGLNHLAVQRILKSGEVPNTFILSRRSGYRVWKRDWDNFLKTKYAPRPKLSEHEDA